MNPQNVTFPRFVIVFLVLFVSNSVSGQWQAYIHRDSVFMQLKGYLAKKASLDSVRQAYDEEIRGLRDAQQEQYNVLLTPYCIEKNESPEQIEMKLSNEDRERLKLLQEADVLIEKRIKTYNSLLQRQYQLNIQPYIDKVNQVIELYAKKNKIDFIWVIEDITNQLAYFNKGKNVTKSIAEWVNKGL